MDSEVRQREQSDTVDGCVKSTEPFVSQDVPTRVVWRNVFLFIGLHSAALYGLYLMVVDFNLAAFLFGLTLTILNGVGVTAGAHRLYAHRAYKAKWPLRLFLIVMNTMSFQNSIYVWVRDHRTHHKFAETNADPHNVNRGFFFAHMGWLMCKKHPDVTVKGNTIDMTDIWADPIVRFQHRFYIPLLLVFWLYIPTMVPHYLFGVPIYNCLYFSVFRYTMLLHGTWLVNSAAHLWGNKPYDKFINPSENKWVSFVAAGEGWHNYHHTFPWDYSTSELGWHLNLTTMFIDGCAKLGLAYDLRTADRDTVLKRKLRTGDGSRLNGAESSSALLPDLNENCDK